MSMLQNALSGLKSSQILLDNASNNIANVNTPGFTRQEGVLVSRSSDQSPFSAGNGVEVSSLRRIGSDYAQSALFRAQGQAGYFNELKDQFGQLEGILGSEGLSLAGGVDELFSAFNSAATEPQSVAIRQQVLVSADNLTKRFNQLAVNIDLKETQITDQANYLITDLNQKLSSFSQLNDQIVRVTAEGGNTSQLQDQRDVLIKEISGQVNVSIQRNPDGRIDLSMPSGEPLVIGSRAATVSLTGSDLGIQFGAQGFVVREAGSQLGALLDFRDTKLADIRDSLNTQAADIADQINTQMVQGYDLSSNPGVNLFSYDPADPSGTLSTTGIDPEELAFIGDNAGTPAGGPGDNQNLLQIIGLKDNFYDTYTDMMSNVAIETNRVNSESAANTSLLQAAQAKRDNISAVNQDEEAMNLVAFTQSYQANAKVISMADQLFNTLLGMFR